MRDMAMEPARDLPLESLLANRRRDLGIDVSLGSRRRLGRTGHSARVVPNCASLPFQDDHHATDQSWNMRPEANAPVSASPR